MERRGGSPRPGAPGPPVHAPGAGPRAGVRAPPRSSSSRSASAPIPRPSRSPTSCSSARFPYPHSDQLVKLWERAPYYARMELSPPNYRDWKAAATVVREHGSVSTGSRPTWWGGGPGPARRSRQVTSDILPMLRISPALGRVFAPADDGEEAPGTVVLSYGLWQSRFGADGSVLGRRLLLDGMPARRHRRDAARLPFPQPRGGALDAAQVRPRPTARTATTTISTCWRDSGPVCRSTPASAELEVITGRLEREYPRENEQTGASLLRFAGPSASTVARPAPRALRRRPLHPAHRLRQPREPAARADAGAAEGAGAPHRARRRTRAAGAPAPHREPAPRRRRRRARHRGGRRHLAAARRGWCPPALPIGQIPSIDLRILLFAGILTALTAVGFGVVPALRAARDAGLEGLREGARAMGSGKQRLRAVPWS